MSVRPIRQLTDKKISLIQRLKLILFESVELVKLIYNCFI